jgi:predicted small secreted protein
MKKSRSELLALLALSLVLAGCSTGAGGVASDVGLAGAGGVLGYKLSDGNAGVAAAGAAAGYVVSKVAQSEYKSAAQKAEKAGYDRAMNQAVKQQYWIMQNQQKTLPVDDERPRLVPVVMPETNINGVIQKAHVEYLRLEQ